MSNAEGKDEVTDQGDHFHALWSGRVGLNKAQRQASKALAEAEEAQKEMDKLARQGRSREGIATRVSHAWRRAEKAMDAWQECEQVWERIKQALQLITPEGELNTRAKAQAVLDERLPQLPDKDFAKLKRQLQQPEILNYLDRVHKRIADVRLGGTAGKEHEDGTEQKDNDQEDEMIKQAAVRQEILRRRPELLQGNSPQAAARRGVLLTCAIILGKAQDKGVQAVSAVREIFRGAYRASSLVECINSVLRMHQAGHRKMTQELLDLKRLYWNCHTFQAGRRRKTTPYGRLGVPLPPDLNWWELLKMTPEQLRNKLSTTKMAA